MIDRLPLRTHEGSISAWEAGEGGSGYIKLSRKLASCEDIAPNAPLRTRLEICDDAAVKAQHLLRICRSFARLTIPPARHR
jgi:hypothetical protein